MCRILLIVLAGLLLSSALTGCSSTASTENKKVRDKKSDQSTRSDLVEGFFIAPGIDLSRYQKIIISELDLDKLVIIQPPSMRQSNVLLDDEVKQFYRAIYRSAVIDHLVADGGFATALDPGANVLLVSTAIVQIAPVDTGAMEKKPSPAMQTYLESTNLVTVTIEVHDSLSQRLLATLTDTQEVDQMRGENNRLVHSAQMRRAFDHWLSYMRQELDILSMP